MSEMYYVFIVGILSFFISFCSYLCKIAANEEECKYSITTNRWYLKLYSFISYTTTKAVTFLISCYLYAYSWGGYRYSHLSFPPESLPANNSRAWWRSWAHDHITIPTKTTTIVWGNKLVCPKYISMDKWNIASSFSTGIQKLQIINCVVFSLLTHCRAEKRGCNAV